MTYRIEPKPQKCQSYGGCLAIAPKVFGWDRAHKVRLVDQAGAPEATILKAAKLCPYRAIALSDAATGEKIFPRGGA
jgi:molecular chaperone DnaJ